MTDSYLVADKATGKVHTHAGPDAMRRIQAITLWTSLALYRDTKIIPTRGFGITLMLALAEQICGRKFKRSQVNEAIDHLKTFADEMLAALPIEEK